MISDKTQVPDDLQYLIVNGRIFDDLETIDGCDVKDDTTISVVGRPKKFRTLPSSGAFQPRPCAMNEYLC